jgi:Tfp pilus assembly protein FimT
MKIKTNTGISLMEILIGISIMLILGSVSISVIANLSNSVSLDRDTNIVASYIDKARTMAINSVDDVEHGVRFETNRVTVFKTTNYSVANTEATYEIPTKSEISSISLVGGGTSFYFNKLTGTPSKSGNVVLSLKNGSETKTITIYATGIVDIQ